MTRKIARQSDITPLKTIDEYLWNERLGVSQLPTVMPGTTPSNTSSLPPDPSAAPDVNYDASVPGSQNDMFGSGVNSSGQPIAPKAPNTTPPSVPATGKVAHKDVVTSDDEQLAGHLKSELHGFTQEHFDLVKRQKNGSPSPLTLDFLHNLAHAPELQEKVMRELQKEAGVSTLYGDVNPTPTTGESGNDGSQANRNNSSENLPNGPDSGAPAGSSAAAAGEEEGGAGLASDLGEAATLALASKHWVGSVLDPVYANIDPDEVLSAHNQGIDVEDYVSTRNNGVNHDDAISNLAPSDSNRTHSDLFGRDEPSDLVYQDLYGRDKPKEASMNWESRFAGKDDKEEGHYKYIKKRGDKYVIIQKGTGKVLSTHDSREKAIASFKAMEMSKHGHIEYNTTPTDRFFRQTLGYHMQDKHDDSPLTDFDTLLQRHNRLHQDNLADHNHNWEGGMP